LATDACGKPYLEKEQRPLRKKGRKVRSFELVSNDKSREMIVTRKGTKFGLEQEKDNKKTDS
jgi:hypothetical protein